MLDTRGTTEDCIDITDLSAWGVSDEIYRELSDQGLMPPAIAWDAFSGDGLCWDRRVFCKWAGDRGFKYGKSIVRKTTSSYVAALKNRFGSEKFAARDVLSISLKNIESTRRSLRHLAEKGILKRCKNKYWFDDFSEVGK